MTRIALATCREYAELDADDRLLLEPLAQLGVSAEPAVWDDPTVDWARFDSVVLRSTWDYPPRLEAFLAWAARVPRLLNPLALVQWNTHKRYLLEVEAQGIPIVPTRLAEPGGAWDAFHDWHEIVVKPAVSAGSVDTARYASDDPRVDDHIRRIHAGGRTVMIQPYHHEVDVHGETALMYIDGRFSHAIRKGPLLRTHGAMTDGLFAPEEITERDPTSGERDLAERVVAFIAEPFGTPLYARIDLLPGPVLIEAEVTEPSLFLGHGTGAADRFARAIAAAVGAG
jgi:glutathione synthase/RimK-type ligase-like ATP-grasp enzyme